MATLDHLGRVALVGRAKILELAAAPVSYVWEDIAVAGTIVLVAGAPAEGKTTLLFAILAARANRGAPIALLDRAVRPVQPDQWIVLIEGEHSEGSTARKLVSTIRALRIDDAALERFVIVARKSVQIGSDEWKDVCTMVEAGLVSDIAIDTIARVAPGDANDEQEQVAIFNSVAQAIEVAPEARDKPIVWMVAHTKKAGRGGELADVSGSVQRVGQADTVLLLKGERHQGRTVATVVTFAKLREGPDEHPMPAKFQLGGAENAQHVARSVAPLAERIVALLAAGPRTKWALRSALGAGALPVDRALRDLVAQRAIAVDRRQVGGRDRDFYIVVTRAPASAVASK